MTIENKFPFVQVTVKYTDLFVLQNAFKHLSLNTMEKIVIEDRKTVQYLAKTEKKNEGSELVTIELHIEDDIPYLLRAINNNSFNNGLVGAEIRHYETWFIQDLIKALPAQYEQQIVSEKIRAI